MAKVRTDMKVFVIDSVVSILNINVLYMFGFIFINKLIREGIIPLPSIKSRSFSQSVLLNQHKKRVFVSKKITKYYKQL